ncbi:universal stress protein [Vreelandella zhaodongensis]|uniref:universal stress protein n=1 Tax=Vreelandella zhaodongensis TaxID=1176240 RepID=UPI003EC10DF7
MFKHIMVPVDLAHMSVLESSLDVVADMAKHYDASITYVGVTSSAPNSVARTPDEYQQKLEAFAQHRHSVHGQPVAAKVYATTDPTANIDDILVESIDELGIDLVIMATHLPRHLDVVMPSHGGKVATHTSASIFLVRQH